MRLKKRAGSECWYAWIATADGGTRLVSTKCIDKKAAAVRAAELERESVNPAHATQNAATIAAILDDYLDSRVRLKRADGSIHHVKVKSGHLLRLLPNLARDVSHRTMVAYVDKRQAEGARNTTIKKELRVFGAAWKLALRNELVTASLDAVMPELEDDYEPRQRALQPIELVGLAFVLPRNRMAQIAFSVATGAETSAIARAKRSDISKDFSSCAIHGSKRKTRERVVPVPLPWQRTLLAWALRHSDGVGGKLFSSWPNCRNEVNRACKEIGIPRCSPNDWRRTYGTWLRAEGIEPQLIGAAMGHVDSRMVERVYGRLTHEALGKLLAEKTVHLMSANTDETSSIESSAENQTEGKKAMKAVPRDRIELPTRGFSILPESTGFSGVFARNVIDCPPNVRRPYETPKLTRLVPMTKSEVLMWDAVRAATSFKGGAQ